MNVFAVIYRIRYGRCSGSCSIKSAWLHGVLKRQRPALVLDTPSCCRSSRQQNGGVLGHLSDFCAKPGNNSLAQEGKNQKGKTT